MAKIILQDVRGSYVFLQNPRKKEDGGDGKYSIQVLVPKTDKKQLAKINKAVNEVLTAKFGAVAAKKLGRYKLPMRDGDEERDGEEYEGMMFFNANTGKKPGIVNRNNEPADADDLEELCYSGAYFHVSVNIYAFDAKDGGKPGVAVGLNHVMLRKKGDRLDGSTNATSDFADFAEEGDDDDFDDEDM